MPTDFLVITKSAIRGTKDHPIVGTVQRGIEDDVDVTRGEHAGNMEIGIHYTSEQVCSVTGQFVDSLKATATTTGPLDFLLQTVAGVLL
ncbi:hypothetical protein V6N13_020813 [Hibiscus sabdariffa]|uniref:Uncharacterized protein n=1 Tax=Hibiscus sabdariffa TaxID=183260 RepID=A0ABR2EUQ9_9ROSI